MNERTHPGTFGPLLFVGPFPTCTDLPCPTASLPLPSLPCLSPPDCVSPALWACCPHMVTSIVPLTLLPLGSDSPCVPSRCSPTSFPWLLPAAQTLQPLWRFSMLSCVPSPLLFTLPPQAQRCSLPPTLASGCSLPFEVSSINLLNPKSMRESPRAKCMD